MSMTIQELLKPRIKMIAPIPKVFSCGIEVGDVWFLESGFYNLTGAHRIGEVEIDKYPHLFQPLEWWMDRKLEDMPEYVKHKFYPKDSYQYLKVSNHFTNSFGEPNKAGYMANDCYHSYSRSIPIDFEEYQTHLNEQSKKITLNL